MHVVVVLIEFIEFRGRISQFETRLVPYIVLGVNILEHFCVLSSLSLYEIFC